MTTAAFCCNLRCESIGDSTVYLNRRMKAIVITAVLNVFVAAYCCSQTQFSAFVNNFQELPIRFSVSETNTQTSILEKIDSNSVARFLCNNIEECLPLSSFEEWEYYYYGRLELRSDYTPIVYLKKNWQREIYYLATYDSLGHLISKVIIFEFGNVEREVSCSRSENKMNIKYLIDVQDRAMIFRYLPDSVRACEEVKLQLLITQNGRLDIVELERGNIYRYTRDNQGRIQIIGPWE